VMKKKGDPYEFLFETTVLAPTSVTTLAAGTVVQQYFTIKGATFVPVVAYDWTVVN